MKKMLVGLTAAAIALTLTTGGAFAEEAKYSIKIGWAPPNVTGVFETAEQYMQLAAEDAKAHGVDVEIVTIATPDETQFENQVRALENLVQQECDAIICSPGSVDACLNAFKEINDAGIPLILVNLDEAPEGIDVTSIIGFNNITAGTVSAYAMLDQLGGPGVIEPGDMVDVEPGTYLDQAWWEEVYKDFDYSSIAAKIAVIEGISGTIYSIQRNEGFHNVIDQCDNIEIVQMLAGDWDREKGNKAAENILMANDELDAIWASSNEMGMGAAIAKETLGRDEVLISTNDGTPESIGDFIMKDRIVTETWHGFPEWGWYGVETALKAVLGEEIEPFQDIRPRTEYAGNAEDFYPVAHLQEIDWEGILAAGGIE